MASLWGRGRGYDKGGLRPFAGRFRPFGGKARAAPRLAWFAGLMELATLESVIHPVAEASPWRKHGDSTEPSGAATPARRATAVLVGALVMGVATQALFWRTGFGLNFFLWTMLTVAGCLVSVRSRALTRVGYGIIVSAVLLAFNVVRLAGEWTSAIAVPTTLLLLGVLPLALRDRAELTDAGKLPVRALGSLKGVRRAMSTASHLPGVALGGKHEAALQVLKGLAIGLPVTFVFAALLSIDVDFDAMLYRVEAKLGEGLSFAAWTLVTAAGGLVMHALYQRAEAAPHVGSMPSVAYRFTREEIFAAPTATPRMSASTWVMVVGQVAVVFAVFVAVNLKNLFGGNTLVRSSASLTYSNYLHAGVGQLLFATVLSICLVATGHRLLMPRGPHVRGGAVPGGKALVAAEVTLLGLTAMTVLSCAERLAIYEDAYGASRLRLGVAFTMIAVLGALGLTVLKVIRRAWGAYEGSLAAFVIGLAVVASSVNADAYVARTNLDRSARGKPLDRVYLTTLSADARSALSHPAIAAHAGLEADLKAAYCSDRAHTDWRAFRGIGGCAR